MDKEKEIKKENPFKAKEGQPMCNSCVHYKRCAELNNSTVNLDGCVTCKCYEDVSGYGNVAQAVKEFAEKVKALIVKARNEDPGFYKYKTATPDTAFSVACMVITDRIGKLIKELYPDMIQSKSVRMREINPKGFGEDMKFTPSEEAKICLNCNLPECKNRGPCERFKEEIKKLRGKV